MVFIFPAYFTLYNGLLLDSVGEGEGGMFQENSIPQDFLPNKNTQ